MMINKRLIGTVKESKKYIAGNVICQWVSLAANITMMGAIAHMLQSLYNATAEFESKDKLKLRGTIMGLGVTLYWTRIAE